MDRARSKIAIVLFNLGGPDRPEAIKPFLFNLFCDPAIIRAPTPIRWLIAKLISTRRTSVATAIYREIGGASPLLELTRQQASALEVALAEEGEVRVFIAMRYWHPLSEETAARVKEFAPDEVILLPLYPQFSTTTTGSSLKEWTRAARRVGLDAPSKALCCYGADESFAGAMAALVRRSFDEALAASGRKPRLLFSAHGLPESIVKAGDPYQWQVERTVAEVVRHLGVDGLDVVICYQSRVTPQTWIGPDTEKEVERAGHERVPIVLVPVAFVSEHSETLVELDIEYRRVAERAGVPGFWRVPTLQSDPAFIAALAALVRRVRARGAALSSHGGARRCPKGFGDCPHVRAAGETA
ncbi:MAG: ferrochelatase [Proteobacteria bacterium]|nr:ferrochelatase [Pseudomonadota bacterium]